MTVTRIRREQHEPNNQQLLKQGMFRMLLLTAVLMVSVIFFRIFVLDIRIVSGQSMFPSMNNGSIAAVCKIILSPIEVGDVVVIDDNGTLIIKRVIALGGDTVSIDEMGVVYVNGSKMPQEYQIGVNRSRGVGEWVIDNNEIFVLGDNRGNSRDSQIHGPYAEDSVVGRVFGVLL